MRSAEVSLICLVAGSWTIELQCIYNQLGHFRHVIFDQIQLDKPGR